MATQSSMPKPCRRKRSQMRAKTKRPATMTMTTQRIQRSQPRWTGPEAPRATLGAIATCRGRSRQESRAHEEEPAALLYEQRDIMSGDCYITDAASWGCQRIAPGHGTIADVNGQSSRGRPKGSGVGSRGDSVAMGREKKESWGAAQRTVNERPSAPQLEGVVEGRSVWTGPAKLICVTLQSPSGVVLY
jgi:hypothetical protein